MGRLGTANQSYICEHKRGRLALRKYVASTVAHEYLPDDSWQAANLWTT